MGVSCYESCIGQEPGNCSDTCESVVSHHHKNSKSSSHMSEFRYESLMPFMLFLPCKVWDDSPNEIFGFNIFIPKAPRVLMALSDAVRFVSIPPSQGLLRRKL